MEMTHHNHVKRALLIFGALLVAAVVALKVAASRKAAGTPATSTTGASGAVSPANGETLVTEVFTSNPATSNGSPTGTTTSGTHIPVDPLPPIKPPNTHQNGGGRLPAPIPGGFQQPRGISTPPKPMRPAAFANPGASARNAIQLHNAGADARRAVHPATPAPRPNPRFMRPAGNIQPVAAGVSAGKMRSLTRLGAA